MAVAAKFTTFPQTMRMGTAAAKRHPSRDVEQAVNRVAGVARDPPFRDQPVRRQTAVQMAAGDSVLIVNVAPDDRAQLVRLIVGAELRAALVKLAELADSQRLQELELKSRSATLDNLELQEFQRLTTNQPAGKASG